MIWKLALKHPKGWDMLHEIVVRAPDHIVARAKASQNAGEEGFEAWLDPQQTDCSRVAEDGETAVISTFYLNG